jgi:hypothetical protein
MDNIKSTYDCGLMSQILLNNKAERMKPESEWDKSKIIPDKLEDLLKNPTQDCLKMLIKCYSVKKYKKIEIENRQEEAGFADFLRNFILNHQNFSDNEGKIFMLFVDKDSQEILGILDHERILANPGQFYLHFPTMIKAPLKSGSSERIVSFSQNRHQTYDILFNHVVIHFVYYVKGLTELFYKPPLELNIEIQGGPGFDQEMQGFEELRNDTLRLIGPSGTDQGSFGTDPDQMDQGLDQGPSGTVQEPFGIDPNQMDQGLDQGLSGGKRKRKKKTRKGHSKIGRKRTTKRF